MRRSQIRNLILLALLLALMLLALTSTIANFIIEYNWWKEVGQVETWISMLWYSIAPFVAGALVAFIALWVAHAQGLHFAAVRRRSSSGAGYDSKSNSTAQRLPNSDLLTLPGPTDR